MLIEVLSAVDAADFVDVTWRDWREERPTRLGPDYQLDRVLAASTVASKVTADDVELVHDDVTDHAAVTFGIHP